MVDLMSDGRFDLGVGRGFQPVEYQAFGVDQSKSRDIFEEALEVILRAWAEDPVNFKGTHFDILPQSVHPKPLQRPHPPVWIATISEPSFEFAGSRGFNLLCSLVYGFKSDRLRELLGNYREALQSNGHRPNEREIGPCAWSTAPIQPNRLARTLAARSCGTTETSPAWLPLQLASLPRKDTRTTRASARQLGPYSGTSFSIEES